MEDQDRVATWDARFRRMRFGLPGANLVGAGTVFVFLAFVVPIPPEVEGDWGLLLLNLAIFVPAAPLVTVIANVWGIRLSEPVRRWFVSAREPDPRECELTLRQPLDQMRIAAAMWVAIGVVFTTVNAFASLRLALLIAFTIALGGLASSALTYLLTERFTREVTAAALASGAPAKSVGPGVGARVLLAWALAAGIPLLGAVLLAVTVLTGAEISVDSVARSVLFLGILGLVFGLAAMRIAARSIADPIEAVRAAQRRIQAGDFTTEIPVYDGSEVGLLQAGFNEMSAGLAERERIREAFGTYVDHDVAAHILREGTSLAGEEVEVTMLFLDIRGFTTLAERLSAPEVVATLNRLFELIVPIIHAHSGHVDKYIGDGLLAVFGAPRRQPNHADEALAAALEMARAVDDDFGDQLSVGIGLNSGPVVVGSLGGAGRLEFSVIGDAVNVAARVESATRQTGDAVLIAGRTRELLTSTETAFVERPGLTLKGKTHPVEIYTPVAVPSVAAPAPRGSP
jgi:adenylate cyclase